MTVNTGFKSIGSITNTQNDIVRFAVSVSKTISLGFIAIVVLASCATQPETLSPFVYEAPKENWIEIPASQAVDSAAVSAQEGALPTPSSNKAPPKRVVQYKPVRKKRNKKPKTAVVKKDAALKIEEMTDGDVEQVEPVVMAMDTLNTDPSETKTIVRDKPVGRQETVDSDDDGVADNNDQCSDSIKGFTVDSNGCAVFSGIVEGIEFQEGVPTLKESSHGVLDKVAQIMDQQSDLRLSVLTHIESVEDSAVALQLSKRRSLSVIRYLIEKGISSSRVRPNTELGEIGITSQSGVEFRTLSN